MGTQAKPILSNNSQVISDEPVSKGIIKCGNCEYIGPGEKARSTVGVILAWLVVIFAPLITIIYFLATSKYRCPKCKSTFIGVKNKEGVFTQRTKGSRIFLVFICILLGIALLGIMASIVLVSLSSAREKAQEAAFKAQVSGMLPTLLLACDERSITSNDFNYSGDTQYFNADTVYKTLDQDCGKDGASTFSFSVTGVDQYGNFSAICSEQGCNFDSSNLSSGSSEVTEANTHTIEETLIEVSNETNKELPVMVDEATQLYTTKAEQRDFIYMYRLIGSEYEAVTQQDINDTLRKDIVNETCTTQETKKNAR